MPLEQNAPPTAAYRNSHRYASDTQLIREGDTVALFTWVVIFLKYMLG